jgi:dipeptidyl aminopeptidase/acylaminoacyl peptidase
LIVHGNKDETVPVEQSKKMAGMIENCRLEIIDGGDHTYSKEENFRKLLELISKFIIQNS